MNTCDVGRVTHEKQTKKDLLLGEGEEGREQAFSFAVVGLALQPTKTKP